MISSDNLTMTDLYEYDSQESILEFFYNHDASNVAKRVPHQDIVPCALPNLSAMKFGGTILTNEGGSITVRRNDDLPNLMTLSVGTVINTGTCGNISIKDLR
jgi:hypothetical protein